MESASMSGRRKDPPAIIVPQRSLVVLSGPAGAGKSTFALRIVQSHSDEGFRPSMVVSSDQCRVLVSDDENNQQANRDTFDLFHYIIYKRMLQDRFTIADSTALQPEARRRLLALAARNNYYTCLLIFNIPSEICAHRDKQRNRLVGEQVIVFHNGLLQRVVQEAPGEGWNQVYILRDEDLFAQIEITRNS
jgi:predicted kinase